LEKTLSDYRANRQFILPVSIAALKSAANLGHRINFPSDQMESPVGVKKTGKGRRKLGRKKRRMRSRIRHRKG
jgi:hypothetical protein